MVIDIKEPDQVLSLAGDLAQYANNVLQVTEDLNASSTQISNAWASDTIDKDSYLKELNANITKLITLTEALSKLSNTLTVYASKQIKNTSE